MTDKSATSKPVATMPNAGFVHLHVHSAYSLLKGSIKIQKLAELAKADRQPALALTDTDNMFGRWSFPTNSPATASSPSLVVNSRSISETRIPTRATRYRRRRRGSCCWRRAERGYRSLMRLNSRAFLETPVNQTPHIKFDWLRGDAEDLIALTGGPEGPISLAISGDQNALAEARCDRLASLFGDRLYIELQRHGIDKERRAEGSLIDLAYTKGLPLVATNEPILPPPTIMKPMTRCCASPADA